MSAVRCILPGALDVHDNEECIRVPPIQQAIAAAHRHGDSELQSGCLVSGFKGPKA
jgi:hypothetical protein